MNEWRRAVTILAKMRIKNTLFFLALACFLYTVSILYSGCAQVGMPTGGVRDSLPPVLLTAIPKNGSLNVKENRIVLTFNEYVQLEDVQQSLIVSPVPKINPNIDFKLKTVTIRMKDTLQPNTTYRIELGNSIRDLNENNPIKDYSFVFSTGPYIDSLTLSGNVELAEIGQKADSTMSVFLYSDLSDSAVFKKKPAYITRVNKGGNFNFKNLPPGNYHIFALKDDSGQKMYASKTQLFAFADSSVEVSGKELSIQLFAYQEEKEIPKPPAAPKLTAELKFTSSLTSGIQDLLTPLVLEFNKPLKNFNGKQIVLSDTLFKPLPIEVKISDTLNKEVTIKSAWLEDTQYKLVIAKEFATDTAGVALTKNDTLSFKTKRESEYGSIKINLKNLEKFKHPVLQFVKNKVVEYSYPLSSPQFFQKLFIPGDYEIRILEDSNQNGVWDPGFYDPANSHLQKQPEKVVSIPQILNIKAGWDNERDVILE